MHFAGFLCSRVFSECPITVEHDKLTRLSEILRWAITEASALQYLPIFLICLVLSRCLS